MPFECLNKLMSYNTCLVLYLRIVHISWREPEKVENILSLVASQNTLDIWTDGNSFLYTVSISNSDFVL